MREHTMAWVGQEARSEEADEDEQLVSCHFSAPVLQELRSPIKRTHHSCWKAEFSLRQETDWPQY